IEYAKAGPNDLLVQITAHNRGPDDAPLHVLPQLWFRNTWSWSNGSPKPELAATDVGVVTARHPRLGDYSFFAEGGPDLLFCENETNFPRLFGGNGEHGYYKDAFHDYVVRGDRAAVNPRQTGTKAAAHYAFTVPAGGSVRVRLRLT